MTRDEDSIVGWKMKRIMVVQAVEVVYRKKGMDDAGNVAGEDDRRWRRKEPRDETERQEKMSSNAEGRS